MSTYIPDFWIKHPENKEQIEKLVWEIDSINYKCILQSRGDGLERWAKTTIIVQKIVRNRRNGNCCHIGAGTLF